MSLKLKEIVIDKLTLFKESLLEPLQPRGVYQIGLLVVIIWMGRFFFRHDDILTRFLLPYGIFIIVAGFCWELYRLFIHLKRNATLGSFILAIPSSALIVSLSVVAAEQLINEATQTNPAYFPNSRNLLASLSIPFVLTYFFAAGLFLYYVFMFANFCIRPLKQIVLSSFGRTVSTKQNSSVEVGRLIGASFLAFSIPLTLGGLSAGPGSPLQPVIKYIVVMMDHYPYAQCVNTNSHERYRLIDTNKLSVVSKTRAMVFSERSCEAQ